LAALGKHNLAAPATNMQLASSRCERSPTTTQREGMYFAGSKDAQRHRVLVAVIHSTGQIDWAYRQNPASLYEALFCRFRGTSISCFRDSRPCGKSRPGLGLSRECCTSTYQHPRIGSPSATSAFPPLSGGHAPWLPLRRFSPWRRKANRPPEPRYARAGVRSRIATRRSRLRPASRRDPQDQSERR
jgi:hypothetical protein